MGGPKRYKLIRIGSGYEVFPIPDMETGRTHEPVTDVVEASKEP